MTEMIDLINATMEELRQMLVMKNQAYGNSAIEPVRIFSRADNIEQLKVRIDDKISRVMRGNELAGESAVDDMIGYLVLLKIARRLEDAKSNIGNNGPQNLNGGFQGTPFPPQPGPHQDQQPFSEDLLTLSQGMENWYADQQRRVPT